MLPNEVICTYLTIQILQGAVQKNHRFESILKYPKCFVGVRIDINRQLWNFCIKCIFASLHQIQVILSKYKYQLTALWLGKSVLKNCTRASTASLFPSIKKISWKFFITSLSFPFDTISGFCHSHCSFYLYTNKWQFKMFFGDRIWYINCTYYWLRLLVMGLYHT